MPYLFRICLIGIVVALCKNLPLTNHHHGVHHSRFSLPDCDGKNDSQVCSNLKKNYSSLN